MKQKKLFNRKLFLPILFRRIKKPIFHGLVLSLLLVFPLQASWNSVVFTNTGGMYVGSNGSTSIHVSGSLKMSGSGVLVYQEGTTDLSGDFYQDASGVVFQTNASGWSNGGGTVRFIDLTDGSNAGKDRLITSSDLSGYKRAAQYIAFPTVEVASNDTVRLPAQMGMDAVNVIRSAGKTGALLLKSNQVDGRLCHASLRISGSNATTPGAVVVEHHAAPYRSEGSLIPFASPYQRQQSIYFAGNWVRKMLTDADGHTTYVMGNKPAPGGSVIAREQYVRDATENLVGGNPYLIKLRGSSDAYENNPAGYLLTSGTPGENYMIDTYVFNGKSFGYNVAQTSVFSDNTLFSQTAAGSKGSTINWVIGNSYTASLDAVELVKQVVESELLFENKLYYFFPGQSTWLSKNITSSASPQIEDLEEIPTRTLFMVRVSKSNKQSGTFSLDRSLQTHGNATANGSNPAPKSPWHTGRNSSEIFEDILFTLAPADNPLVYDKTVIGLREGSSAGMDKLDMEKLKNTSDNTFMLYSTCSTGESLLSNALPFEAQQVSLCVQPGRLVQEYTLSASRQESMNTEALLLHDELTGEWIDLRRQSSYTFSALPEDPAERFTLYFNEIDKGSVTSLKGYYNAGSLHIHMLQEMDLNSRLSLYDMQGMLLMQTTIDSAPHFRMPVELSSGVYLAVVEGARCVNFKFISQP